MRRFRSLSTALVLGTLLVGLGCSDMPTVPETTTQVTADGLKLFGALDLNLGGSDGQADGAQGGEALVTVLKRAEPLISDEVVTKTIGLAGGKIRLPQAGFEIRIPPLALTRRVAITVTAKAGDLVGYEFQPHGLVFLLPVTAVQDENMLDLPAGDGNIFAAYHEGELLPQVSALEILGIEITGPLKSFLIWHFSGYVIATD